MMKVRKLLAAAVAAACGTAQAVSLSSDGRGDVLIYPYYTVRNGFETYVTLTNTSSDTKAVRVRFLESMNGAEVLDFNLYMPPGDVWTGAVIATDNGARLITSDTSCTTPSFVDSPIANFVNYYYNGNVVGVLADAGPKGLDRTREGMLEVFDMGVVTTAATGAIGLNVVNAVRLDSAGRPVNCEGLQTFSLDLRGQLGAPSGGLAGAGYLVNSAAGLEFGYDAVALTEFARAETGGIWYSPGNSLPNFNNANPRVSRLFATSHDANGQPQRAQLYEDVWENGHDAVSALLMTQSLTNDFVLDSLTASQTEWVVTFPTKRGYVNMATGATLGSAVAPFQRPFRNVVFGGVTGSACDDFDMNLYNREGKKYAPPASNWGGVPPASTPYKPPLCAQASVLRFSYGGRQQLAAPLLDARPNHSWVTDVDSPNGFATIDFGSVTTIAPIVTRSLLGSANAYYGLPAVGFMLQTFRRDGLIVNGVPSTSGFGGSFVHRPQRRIVPR